MSGKSTVRLENLEHPATQLTEEELDRARGGLVVNAIIAVHIGLLLPAVQKVRGTGFAGASAGVTGSI